MGTEKPLKAAAPLDLSSFLLGNLQIQAMVSVLLSWAWHTSLAMLS